MPARLYFAFAPYDFDAAAARCRRYASRVVAMMSFTIIDINMVVALMLDYARYDYCHAGQPLRAVYFAATLIIALVSRFCHDFFHAALLAYVITQQYTPC